MPTCGESILAAAALTTGWLLPAKLSLLERLRRSSWLRRLEAELWGEAPEEAVCDGMAVRYRLFGPHTAGPVLLAFQKSGVPCEALARRFPETGLRVLEVEGGVAEAQSLLKHLQLRPLALAAGSVSALSDAEALGMALWVADTSASASLEERARFYALMAERS
ncbi:unnamed protein product [Symbiodinium natans]|uniref:Uncharacterized protein n=1 Tax=Symbiodinium natans TaxID=878477 RepID=A0A812PS52_9DINO|nr:unnamed protein product [Symbiodinium natans]